LMRCAGRYIVHLLPTIAPVNQEREKVVLPQKTRTLR